LQFPFDVDRDPVWSADVDWSAQQRARRKSEDDRI
jgi:hypothetical protein